MLNKTDTQQATQKKPANSFTFVKASAPHQEHMERNEDFALVDPQRGLAIICDGVGSAVAAGQAARIAARTIKKRWQQIDAHASDTSSDTAEQAAIDLNEIAQQLVEEANQAVLALHKRQIKNAQLTAEKTAYAETTIVLALISPEHDSYRLTYAHVGDSRAYLLRQDAGLERLTIDDGYFLHLMNHGEINEQDAARIDQACSKEQLNMQELEYFHKRNGITQALGGRNSIVHVGQTEMRPGDRLLLCTDGIHDNLTDLEIAELLRKGARTTIAKILLQHAQARSLEDVEVYIRAKKDDMTALVVTYHPPAL